eukprot:TRINITY_DN4377_c0_g1_i12.p1 TRINITY_DN4377_c0_g1~~TRINITY_DN4377_c0_g1_i12.p1  ORF type:complete len:116 (-),score=12.65 TRINITY_DN4377_c0_g1_i12:114-461(-)
MEIVVVNFLQTPDDEFCEVSVLHKFSLSRPNDQIPENIVSIDFIMTKTPNMLVGTTVGNLYILNFSGSDPISIYKAKIPHQRKGQEGTLSDIMTVKGFPFFYTASKNVITLWQFR